jgi:NAD(P)-dependent dehydrogenase (short-subunit alcohol dehydrogenase family)
MYKVAVAPNIRNRAKRQEVVMGSELAGKVAIVTGGASGIGRASVAALLGAGATVAVLDRDQAGVDAVVNDGKKSSGKAFALIVDLAEIKRIPEAVAKVLKQFGRIDILVNCAGVTGKFQALLEIDDENWDFVHTVNLKAPMLLMKHVARHMIDRGGGGRIINISSRLGVSRAQLADGIRDLKGRHRAVDALRCG